MANPPEELVTVTAWQSPGTSPVRSIRSVIVELLGDRLERGLDPLQRMKVSKVNLLKTETSCSARVAIKDQKEAMDLDISAVPPWEAPDNSLLHLQDSPAWPKGYVRDHTHRTVPKAASRSAWMPPQVSDDELQVCGFLECEPWQSAIWQRTLLLYSLMR